MACDPGTWVKHNRRTCYYFALRQADVATISIAVRLQVGLPAEPDGIMHSMEVDSLDSGFKMLKI